MAEKRSARIKKKRERESLTKAQANNPRQAGGRAQQDANVPSDDEDDDSILDLQIPTELLELIEDPDEETEYPVPFDSPDELMNIFRELEDQNLFLISQSQENEEQIEVLRQEQ